MFEGSNYTNFVEKARVDKNKQEESDVEIIKQYTFHDTWYCTKVNLLLASDSDDLRKDAEYIKRLQISIQKRAKKQPVSAKVTFRGMHQSEKEFLAYELKEMLYIPSFLSTSKNEEKFYMASQHNSLLRIELNYKPNNAIDVDSELSNYSEEEEEVLFNCYSKFKVIEKRRNYIFKGKNFEYFLRLEHINQPIFNLETGCVLMLNALGF